LIANFAGGNEALKQDIVARGKLPIEFYFSYIIRELCHLQLVCKEGFVSPVLSFHRSHILINNLFVSYCVSMKIYLLLVLYIVQCIGYIWFLKGFFPVKAVLQGEGDQHCIENYQVPDPKFDKLIFMVVDALRSDFVFSNHSSMEFVHSLLNGGKALGYTAYSNPPTVTLPRLKAITTGSTPSFLDAILNIAEDDQSSSLSKQDSWVKQLWKSGAKVNMFGDDTWTKLFPEYFNKVDGTSSFYVADFTEVDNNVTRHLNYELQNAKDWDCMILHYLGLDHIGHKGGPNSPNMPPKQKEMDEVVKTIYSKHLLNNPNTLMILLGDHGMNDAGNHGGSSAGETSAGLVFISEQFSFHSNRTVPQEDITNSYQFLDIIQQIDLVPTLSGLLGIPIPKNNIGKLIPEILNLYCEHERKSLLFQNAYQLKRILEEAFGRELNETNDDNSDFHLLSSLFAHSVEVEEEASIHAFINTAQDFLMSSYSDYNYFDIYFGFILFLLCSLVVLADFSCNFQSKTNVDKLIQLFIFTYSVTMHGSSLVEEEHQTWWGLIVLFSLFSYFLLIDIKVQHKYWNFFAIMAFLRLMRAWNYSGQKFNILSVVTTSSLLQGSSISIWSIGILAYCVVLNDINRSFNKESTGFRTFITIVSCFEALSSVLAKLIGFYSAAGQLKVTPLLRFILNYVTAFYKLDEWKDCVTPLLQLSFEIYTVTTALTLLRSVLDRKSSHIFPGLLSLFNLFLLNQTKLENMGLLVCVILVQKLVCRLLGPSASPSYLFTYNLLLQNFSFFCMGNTNALSSIDLSNSFNGLRSYDVIPVGILTFISNWSLPIVASLGSLQLIKNSASQNNPIESLIRLKLLFNMLFYSVAGSSLLMSCFNLRFHLFIWTVFSPKLLFFLSWFGLHNLLFDSLFGVAALLSI